MTNISQKYCLNCNTEVHGKYCHECGQKVTHGKPTIKEFISEYLNIAFVWDRHLIKTLRLLLTRPGKPTVEYMSGKVISYTHPLKLNMFLLFVFITFFLLFHNADDMGDSIKNITRSETTQPLLQLELMTQNEEYSLKLQSSGLDTIQLYAPSIMFDEFPEIIDHIDGEITSPADSIAIWTASVPHLLIEDGTIILHKDGYYHFSNEYSIQGDGIEIIENVWAEMVDLTTNYFPIIIILTAPFLSILIRFLQLKGEHSHFRHFIFALHYTAFLEVVIIFLYILHLIASPPSWIMQSIIISGSVIYLTLAFRRVYETKKWFAAISKALLTNMGYVMILMILFICIFFIACITVVSSFDFTNLS